MKKHYTLLKKARGSLHSNKESRRNRIVVMRLLKVVWFLMSRPQLLYQNTTLAAGKSLFQQDMYDRHLSHRSIEYCTKESRCNNNCVWFYSFIFVWPV